MKLYAISDLHLANRVNREGLLAMPAQPDDWLILAGDVGETESQLHFALSVLAPRFQQLIWVPGNHDLWSMGSDSDRLMGEAKYLQLVKICRSYGCLTPEDPYPEWPGDTQEDGSGYVIAPLFLLYDYTFRPDHIPPEEAVAWAEESGVLCSDEYLLKPHPYPSRPAWCQARVAATERRLEAALAGGRKSILVNHFPLLEDLVQLRRIPRFSIWCGTRLTNDWHRRFRAAVVVYGHLHIKSTQFRDGVRFEEVSLGYPRDWNRDLGVAPYLRQIFTS
jgi:hypothetical protein